MNLACVALMLIAAGNCSASILDIFFNPDRQGYHKYLEQNYDAAYKKFQDAHWKGIAALKLQNYEKAIEHLVELQDMESKYNLGSAYALKGDLDNAISVYEDVLKINPNHEDAKYNLDLIKKIKEQNKNNKEQNNSNKDQKHQSDKQEQQKGSDNKKQGQQPEKQQKSSDNKEQNQQSKEQQNDANQDNSQNQDGSNQNKKKQQDDTKKDEESSQTKADDNQHKEEQQKSRQNAQYDEAKQADEQWLRSIPDDPGGLLRQKFLRDHLQRRGK